MMPPPDIRLTIRPQNYDIVIWKGIDFVLPIYLQHTLETAVGTDMENNPVVPSNLSIPNNIVDIYPPVIYEHITKIDFVIYSALSKTINKQMDPLMTLTATPIQLDNVSPTDIPGCNGKFSAIVQRLNMSVDSTEYITLHIPNIITEEFGFTDAFYNIIFTDDNVYDETEDEADRNTVQVIDGRLLVYGESL